MWRSRTIPPRTSETPANAGFHLNEQRISISRRQSFTTKIRNGELRRIAAGCLDKRLHLLCYVPKPDGIRVISFRKTNEREAKRYGKAQSID